MNGIMELNKLSVYSFKFCLKTFLYCKSLSNTTTQPHPVKQGVRTRISQILWIWVQIWCCQGCSWGSRWYPWIQGWWCFWKVITLCPFSKFIMLHFTLRWLVLCHHSVFWLFRQGLPILISTPTFVFFVSGFSTDLLLLYRAVFALSAIVCTVSINWFKFSFATLVQR